MHCFFRAFAPTTLIFLSIACGSADDTIDQVHDACAPLVILPDDDASYAEQQSARDAAMMWSDLANAQLGVDPRDGASTLHLRFRLAAGAFFGLYDDETGEVIVNRRLSDDHERAVTIAHELGHAMGLVHVDRSDRISVMNPANLNVLPTAEDRAALVALWGECE